MEELQVLISTMVKALVDLPDKVVVNPVQGDQTLVFEIQVDKSDLGKVIGRQGNNARALRTILTAVATKHRKRAVLDILE